MRYDGAMNRFCDITPVEIASTAALLSDVARATILCALLDGRARTAGELAYAAAGSRRRPPAATWPGWWTPG